MQTYFFPQELSFVMSMFARVEWLHHHYLLRSLSLLEQTRQKKTYDQQRHAMFHEGWAAAKKARQQNDNRYGNQYVDSDVIWIDVEDFNPLFEARLHSYPQREGKQAETDELWKKEKKKEGECERNWIIFFMSSSWHWNLSWKKK